MNTSIAVAKFVWKYPISYYDLSLLVYAFLVLFNSGLYLNIVNLII